MTVMQLIGLVMIAWIELADWPDEPIQQMTQQERGEK